MSDSYLILTPVLMLAVLTLARFVGCNLFFEATLAEDQTFVTMIVPRGVRNDFTGWVGMAIKVGADSIEVSALGRWIVAGTTQPHIVKVVQERAGGAGDDLGFVTIPLSPASEAFAYVTLDKPVTLAPETRYFIVSHEEAGGDSWHHADTTVVATTVAVVTSAVFNDDANPLYVLDSSIGHTFGPVDFRYRVPS